MCLFLCLQIPPQVALGMERLVEETKHGDQLVMNICLSYGSRGEIVNACKEIAKDVKHGFLTLDEVTLEMFERKLLTKGCPDPDLVIRTSGEYRLSNFLLWQMAYSELFFLNKTWPEMTKDDFLFVIRQYARERKRRFGK
jgi:undecaprenyl diphosphate synthase